MKIQIKTVINFLIAYLILHQTIYQSFVILAYETGFSFLADLEQLSIFIVCFMLVIVYFIFIFYEGFNIKNILIFFILSITVLISVFLFPENNIYYGFYSFKYHAMVSIILLFVILRNIYSIDRVCRSILLISLFTVPIIILYRKTTPGTIMNYMDLGVALIIPTTICIYYGVIKNKITLIFGMCLLVYIAIYANRGILLTALVFCTLLILVKSRKSKTKKYLIVISGFLGAGLLANSEEIIYNSAIFLQQKGFQSRMITMVINKRINNDSGRSNIYEAVLSDIKNFKLFGNGIYGDRKVIQESLGIQNYSHNFFLEIMSDFGILFGVIIFVALIISIVRVFLDRDKMSEKKLLWKVLWISVGITPLIFSMSFLQWAPFWIMLGTLFKEDYYEKNMYNNTSLLSRDKSKIF